MRLVRCVSIILPALLLALSGCGGSAPSAKNSEDAAAPAASAESSPTGDQAQPGAGDPAQAAETVGVFLAAVKDGDHAKAESLLTAKALEETKKHDLVISPPGSPTAEYTIGAGEAVDGGAHVSSTWTDGEGEYRRTDELIWVLRHEQPGWRIVGLITKPFEDLPPVALDFEDPEDMMRQQQLVAQEFARRAQGPAETNGPSSGEPTGAEPDGAGADGQLRTAQPPGRDERR